MTAAELNTVLGPIWADINRTADTQERIAKALERIADGIEWFVSTRPAEEEDVEMGCPHPLEKRLALGTVGDGWQCACGHLELGTKVTQ